MKKNSGFTLLEILTVVGIILIIFSITSGAYFMLRQSNKVNSDSQKIVSVLRLAQNRALATNGFATHGVHFDTINNTYTIFEGLVFDSMNPNNEEIQLDPSVEFSNIQLAEGSVDVLFQRLSGNTSSSGFIEIIRRGDSGENKIICISQKGRIRILNTSEVASSCIYADVEYVGGLTNSDLAVFPSGTAFGDVAQSFTTDTDILYISKADLYMRYNDDDIDSVFSDIFLEIRESSTTGNVVGKSILIDGDNIPSSLSWVSFDFISPVELQASTTYFLRLRSLPSSTIISSGAEGTIIWGYENSATAPPAYSDGDAWRYVGANNIPSDTGQQLGPVDQYDFSFRLYSQEGPLLTDSRHLEFNLEDSLRNYTNLILTFDGGTLVETIAIAGFMNMDSSKFSWENPLNIGGNSELIKIHSIYIDANDTILSIHRNQEDNDLSLGVNLDSTDVVDYTAGGTPTKGSTIGSMIYR